MNRATSEQREYKNKLPRSKWQAVLLLTALVLFGVGGALFYLFRANLGSGPADKAVNNAPEATRETVEMVPRSQRRDGAGGDAPSETLRPMQPSEHPSAHATGEPGETQEGGAREVRPVFVTGNRLNLRSLPADLHDLALATMEYRERAVLPISLVNGMPVQALDTPRTPPILGQLFAVLAGDDNAFERLPIDSTRSRLVTSQLERFETDVAGIVDLYRAEERSTPYHLLLRDNDRRWWNVWVYVEGGKIADFEFALLDADTLE